MAARFVDVSKSQICVFVLFSGIMTRAILLKQLLTSGSVNIAIVAETKIFTSPSVTNRPLHGFRRHLGCGAVAGKITANVWEILQLSTLIIPQLHVQF